MKSVDPEVRQKLAFKISRAWFDKVESVIRMRSCNEVDIGWSNIIRNTSVFQHLNKFVKKKKNREFEEFSTIMFPLMVKRTQIILRSSASQSLKTQTTENKTIKLASLYKAFRTRKEKIQDDLNECLY